MTTRCVVPRTPAVPSSNFSCFITNPKQSKYEKTQPTSELIVRLADFVTAVVVWGGEGRGSAYKYNCSPPLEQFMRLFNTLYT